MWSGGALAAVGLFGLGFATASAQAAVQGGWPAALLVAAVLPHGLPEMAAFLLLGTVGVAPWWQIWEQRSAPLTCRSRVCAVVTGFALLAISSVVETMVTPHVVTWLLRAGAA
jgi:uncharacterized membrane protein SpoIIM required for sporulation